ncbi:MAG: winged helix-turn-helix transcriptional regulator [Verrucomicrobia bacterium]|nr:winged helix-turn-helix transcriptional regulator [Verrucomicrobiota bacterium]
MLEKLFGNAVIEKILFYLLANEKSYASELQAALGIPLYSIQMALGRLEKGGILVRQAQGKTQLYQFNPRYPFRVTLQSFLKQAYDSLPEEMRIKLYEAPVRRRPRRKDKPL